MQKRTLPMYLFLNCLTLGIYGFIVARQMNQEINALCKGDKQEPAVGYVAAMFIRLIPVFGPIYFTYWWYQQANRLKLNANRYGITVKESGTDVFLMRTVLETPLIFVTVLELIASLLVPSILIVLFSLINPVMGIIFGGIFGLVLGIFSAELTAGANIANYYMMKNLNRFADVYRNGATPFDPMAYEYYPTVSTKYPNFVPNLINGGAIAAATPSVEDDEIEFGDSGEGESRTGILTNPIGSLIGMSGTCAGYKFDLTSGEEIVIGKDAKVSSVVIDPAYKEISRKHVGVCYDIIRDQYRVVDYSSNGTWANGSKLVPGQAVYLSHGAELKLANDKNTFRLG